MSGNIMQYKGYTARIEYSAEDGCLIGEVIGIKHIIGFHGNSVEDMEREFKISIDTYLVACKKVDIKPDRPANGKITINMPLDTYADIASEAAATGQTISDLVVTAVKAVYTPSQSQGGRYPRKRRERAPGRVSR